jgi:N-acetylglutamate synthase-like GNAT family acetyltransferase
VNLCMRPAQPGDRECVEQLLITEQLPLQGLDEHFGSFFVAEIDGEVAAAAGIELYEQYGLLRSVVVASSYRGQRVAERLVRERIEDAARQGICALYLLTMTADTYFRRFGFEPIERDDIPPAVRRSQEYTVACPASARVMSLTLARSHVSSHPR